ncbi:hypothetical protein N9N03_00260, partial [Chlamydiia bacterium]|nr:hypothetical protein [Chlamydiia bacterium]
MARKQKKHSFLIRIRKFALMFLTLTLFFIAAIQIPSFKHGLTEYIIKNQLNDYHIEISQPEGIFPFQTKIRQAYLKRGENEHIIVKDIVIKLSPRSFFQFTPIFEYAKIESIEHNIFNNGNNVPKNEITFLTTPITHRLQTIPLNSVLFKIEFENILCNQYVYNQRDKATDISFKQIYLPLEIHSKIHLKLNQQLIEGEFEIHPEQVNANLSITPHLDTQKISDSYPLITNLNISKIDLNARSNLIKKTIEDLNITLKVNGSLDLSQTLNQENSVVQFNEVKFKIEDPLSISTKTIPELTTTIETNYGSIQSSINIDINKKHVMCDFQTFIQDEKSFIDTEKNPQPLFFAGEAKYEFETGHYNLSFDTDIPTLVYDDVTLTPDIFHIDIAYNDEFLGNIHHESKLNDHNVKCSIPFHSDKNKLFISNMSLQLSDLDMIIAAEYNKDYKSIFITSEWQTNKPTMFKEMHNCMLEGSGKTTIRRVNESTPIIIRSEHNLKNIYNNQIRIEDIFSTIKAEFKRSEDNAQKYKIDQFETQINAKNILSDGYDPIFNAFGIDQSSTMIENLDVNCKKEED